jgi:hypothetical protein
MKYAIHVQAIAIAIAATKFNSKPNFKKQVGMKTNSRVRKLKNSNQWYYRKPLRKRIKNRTE